MGRAAVVCAAAALTAPCAALDRQQQQSFLCASQNTHQVTCGEMRAECVTMIPPHAFAAVTQECIARIPAPVFGSMHGGHLAALPNSAFAAMSTAQCRAMGGPDGVATGSLRPSQCAAIPAHCFVSMNADAVQAMQPECITELPSRSFALLNFDQVKALSKGGIDGLLISQVRSLVSNPLSCGAFDSIWPKMVDPVACGELTTTCWMHLDTGMQAVPDDCVARFSPDTFVRALTGTDGSSDVGDFCRKTALHKMLPPRLRRTVSTSVCQQCIAARHGLNNAIFPQCPYSPPAAAAARTANAAAPQRQPNERVTLGAGWETALVKVTKYAGRLGLATVGTRVTAVAQSSPAEHAGIKIGMAILLVEGRPVATADELTDVLRTQPEQFTMTVLRQKDSHMDAQQQQMGILQAQQWAQQEAGVPVRPLQLPPQLPPQPRAAQPKAEPKPGLLRQPRHSTHFRPGATPAQKRLAHGTLKWQRDHVEREQRQFSTAWLMVPALAVAAAAVTGFLVATRSAAKRKDYSSV